MMATNLDNALSSVQKANQDFINTIHSLHSTLDIATNDGDIHLTRDILQQYLLEVEKLYGGLKNALNSIVEQLNEQEKQDRYSERWVQEKVQTLHLLFQKDEQPGRSGKFPREGLYEWLRTFTTVFIDWYLPTCEKLALALEAFPFPDKDLIALFRDGVQAIINVKFPEALKMLEYLSQVKTDDEKQFVLTDVQRATILVCLGRIILYDKSDQAEALRYFQQAKELAPEHGRVYAALGEYHCQAQDYVTAGPCFQRAIELSPDQPDGYIGMGVALEMQKRSDEADDYYDDLGEVVQNDKDPVNTLGKLFIAISGRAYLSLAKMLRKKNREKALRAIEAGLAIGFAPGELNPEAPARSLKGEILKEQAEDLLKQEKPVEAAQAYYESGQSYYLANEYGAAVEVLRLAKKHAPDFLPSYWYLADALLVQSYSPKPPYVDEELVRESLVIWEEGYQSEFPANDFFWAYLTRARINERLVQLPETDQGSCWWEAIAYLEAGLLHYPDVEKFPVDPVFEAQYLADMGRYYRSVELFSYARSLTQAAYESAPGEQFAQEEQAISLYSTGEFSAAREVLEKRQQLSHDTWSDRFMAEILLAEGSYQEALTSVEKAVKSTPDDVNNRAILADCFLVLKQFERCQEEHEWIWQQYNELDLANRLRFGWTAYITRRYAEALSIYQRLLQEPFDTGNLIWNSGLCYLAQGDLKQGEEYMSKGIALTNASHRLDLYVNFDFLTLEFSPAMAAQPKEVHRVLSHIQQRIAERKETLQAQPRTAEDEFRAAIARVVRKESGPDWPWIGAHMGLANFYLVNQRTDEALDAYQQILDYIEDFREILQIVLLLEGGAQAFQDMLSEAEENIRTGNPARALELYTEIAEKLLPGEEVDRAMLHAFQGYVYFVMNELDNARQHFLDLLRIYRSNNLPDGSEVLSNICNSLLPDEGHRQRLDSLLQAMAAESGMDSALRADLNATRQLLSMLQSTNESTS